MTVLGEIENELKDYPDKEQIIENQNVRAIAEDLDKIHNLRNMLNSEGGQLMIEFLQDDCIVTMKKLRDEYITNNQLAIIPLVAKLDAQLSLLEELSANIKAEKEIENVLKKVIKRITL